MSEMLKLENQICFKIYTAEREITRLYRDLLADLDITYPQYLVLLVLWEDDFVTVKELGQRLFLDSGTLTPMLKRMEANQLITRKRSLEDERSVIISLTDEGKVLKEKATCIPTQLLENLSMETEELLKFDRSLQTILKHLRTNKPKK
ncbi:MarR family transcriptional regulator [Bacillus sp. UMB0899]|uniref:MarR family winged helix-turn-helix transcriptional regulator n=1 Tax=Metabacillus schmidteae TaxID=2730405 RepID=UPI000C805F76|nr:MarR family transcriptional regulator [Metabacillus schmidteae]PMC39120.1 MarR family transcriptional regulator [Bacillus sp. UMB0899]